MRLLALRPANFRAFGPSDWIALDSDLVVISGSNGSGKTSLAEAVEWLLCGETSRRRQGDGYSKVEYRGSYPNVHASGPVEVSARVRLRNGQERTVTRRLIAGAQGAESSQTFVDGKRADFASLGIPAGREFQPVATQHGLQDFIHAGPKERRDAFSAIVGLDSLSDFKTVLDRARLSLQRAAPAEVTAARSAVRALRAKMAWHPVTADLAREWDEDLKGAELSADWALLLRTAQAEAQSRETDVPRLLELLRARRHRAVQSVFDLDAFRPASTLPDQLLALAARREVLADEIDTLAASIERLATIGAGSVSPELLQFWQAGLRIAEREGSSACPMCEESTLTAEKRNDLAGRISIHREYSTAREVAARAVRDLQDSIEGLCSRVEAVLPKAPEELSSQASADLTAPAAAAIASYLRILTQLRDEWEGVQATLDGHRRGLDRLGAALSDPDLALRLMEGLLGEGLEAAPDGILALAGEIEDLAGVFQEMEAHLERELLSTAEARRVEALMAGLEVQLHLSVMSAFNAVREEAAAESRALEKAIQIRQRALLSRLQDSICGYYDLIHPDSSVRFSAIEPAAGAVRLLAESMGEEMSAAACLSTSQLSSLGLALHLVRAANPTSPFDFVVLDDPFQAMDEERCENLIAGVLTRLLDGAHKQVVVLTHRREVAERIRTTHSERQPMKYRVENTGKWAQAQPDPLPAYHS